MNACSTRVCKWAILGGFSSPDAVFSICSFLYSSQCNFVIVIEEIPICQSVFCAVSLPNFRRQNEISREDLIRLIRSPTYELSYLKRSRSVISKPHPTELRMKSLSFFQHRVSGPWCTTAKHLGPSWRGESFCPELKPERQNVFDLQIK